MLPISNSRKKISWRAPSIGQKNDWSVNFSLFRLKPKAGPSCARQDVPGTEPCRDRTLQPVHTQIPIFHLSHRNSGLNELTQGPAAEGRTVQQSQFFISMPFSSPPAGTTKLPVFSDSGFIQPLTLHPKVHSTNEQCPTLVKPVLKWHLVAVCAWQRVNSSVLQPLSVHAHNSTVLGVCTEGTGEG